MRTSLRCLLVLASAVTVVLCTASTASAANLAPNPGFECAFGPQNEAACYWYYESSSSILIGRDTTTSRSGGASYRLEAVGPSIIGVTGVSDCMGPPATGSASMSFWYRVPISGNSSVNDVRMYVLFDDSCVPFAGTFGGSVGTPPIRGNQWQVVSGSVTTQSKWFRLYLEFLCSTACQGAHVNLDDIGFEQTPTSVRLASFSVRSRRPGAELRWRTGSEADTLGFNVYRQQEGKPVKLNRTLIPCVFGGTATGQAYSWLDRSAPTRAATYRLQAVSLSGKRSWVGTAATAR